MGKNDKLEELNEWMAPLEEHKADLVVTKNLWTPRGNGHGAGTATWLTGGSYNGRKNDVGGPSVDQIVARHFRADSPLPSLELSTAGEGSFAGSLPRNCLSWTARDVPAVRETIPRAVFDKLFRRAPEGFVNESVLDLVLAQSKDLKRRASAADGRKIDEYLDSVRAIEKRLEFAEVQSKRAAADRGLTDTLRRPKPGIPTNHEEYVRQMLDLMALAFWSGATRVSTFMLDHGQSNRYFNFLPGVKGTWHALSHWKDASGRTEDDDGHTKWDDARSKKDQYNEVTSQPTGIFPESTQGAQGCRRSERAGSLDDRLWIKHRGRSRTQGEGLAGPLGWRRRRHDQDWSLSPAGPQHLPLQVASRIIEANGSAHGEIWGNGGRAGALVW